MVLLTWLGIYHSGMRLRQIALISAVPLLLAITACAPVEDSPSTSASDPAASGDPTGSSEPAAEPCAKENLAVKMSGMLMIGTDSPAYDPWFRKNDPSNGKGFESAVAYAVAEKLGFTADEVQWVKVPFNSSYKPGAKDFDFDINQISITAKRAEVVDFSDGYYQATQAVIALNGTAGAERRQPGGPPGPTPRRTNRHDLAERDPRRYRPRLRAPRVRGHQRRQAGAA